MSISVGVCRIIEPSAPDVAARLYRELAEDGRYIVVAVEPEIGELINRGDTIEFVRNAQWATKLEREEKMKRGELINFTPWSRR
jgi:hypothetical protein